MQSGPNSNDLLKFILSNTNLLPDFLAHRKEALSLALTSKDMLNTVSWEYNKQLPNSRVIAVAAGAVHSLFLNQDGKVFACGNGLCGQLGNGKKMKYQKPTEILGLDSIVQIAAGAAHSLFLTQEGKVFSCGNGDYGRFPGNENDYLTPKEIPNLNNIVQIAAGHSHSLFLTQDGKVFSRGSGLCGQLEYGESIEYQKPTEILSLPKIVQIAAGELHTLFLTQDGKVFLCGLGHFGGLGFGYFDTPTLIPNLSKIVQIAAGVGHSLFLAGDGTVFSCGDNTYGQLGHGNTNPSFEPKLVKITGLPNIVKIASGYIHTLLLAENGKVFSCGSGLNGKLGLGNTEDYLAPTIIPGLSNVVQVAGGHHTLFLTKAGNIFSCGAGREGQLGHGNTDSYLAPAETPYLKAPIIGEIKIDSQPQGDSWLGWLYSKATWLLPSTSSQTNDAEQSIKRSRDEDSDDLDATEIKRIRF